MRYIIGYSRKTHFFAKAIMWFTKSDKSHAYLRQDGIPGVDYTLESNSHGVNLQWYSVFKRNGPIIVAEFLVDLPEEQLREAWTVTLYEKLNQKYSYLQILGDAWVIAVNWLTGKRVKNPLGQPWRDVCSELVLFFIKKAKMTGYEKFDLQTVAPEDLFLVMVHDPQCTRIPAER